MRSGPASPMARPDAMATARSSPLGKLVTAAGTLLSEGRAAEAEATYRQALQLAPRDPVVVWNLGVLLTDRERHPEALALADGVLTVQPDHARAQMVRGNPLTGLALYAEAAACYRAATASDPTAYEALTKLGVTHAALGHPDAALEALGRAVALRPDEPIAYFRRAIVRLGQRDFAGGWPDYEARWRVPAFVAQSAGVVPPALVPRLTLNPAIEAVAGRRVLVLGEQGIGDQVMFASMIPDLTADAARVTCICDSRLTRLFQASFPAIETMAARDARVEPDAIDTVLAMGSLGPLYRRDVDVFPGAPYLRPRPEVRARWAERLGPRPRGLRVGLSWRGGTASTRAGERSLTLDQLRPLLGMPDCEFVSLQYGDAQAELAGTAIRAFAPEALNDFEDLAALVSELDVVVSVQTALVHLAGALGQPCLTLVPYNAEWRYTADGPSMPWYRSVRILRQTHPGAWDPVIAEAADWLRQRLGDLS